MEAVVKKNLKILIVDDDDRVLKVLKQVLEEYELTSLSDGKEAIDSIKNGNKYDILVIDFRLQAFSGLNILMEAKKHLACYKAILLTAYSDKELLEQVVNNNLVYRVINKPVPENFADTVDEAAESLLKDLHKSKYVEHLKSELDALMISASVKSCDQIIIHKSAVMKEAVAAATRYAASPANLMLTGENGVGKEVFANIVHISGKRAEKPFVKVNCTAIPENLFESELFGHEKGAFTGAIKSKAGKFKLADGGSIFLDEIGELSMNLQPKLLRVIEKKEFSPIGSTETLKTDVRIICATNADLQEKVASGKFREDLFYRLNILNIHVPSLRERREDIPILAAYFIKTISLEEGGAEREITPEALEYLSKLEFRGNVRQLMNIVHRLYLSGDNSEITLDDVVIATRQPRKTTSIENPFDEEMPLSPWLDKMERMKIEATLAKCDNNVSKAAKILGMQTNNMYRKMKEQEISLGKKNDE